MKFPSAFLTASAAALHDYFDINVSNDEVNEALMSDEECWEAFWKEEFETVDYTDSTGMDTYPREVMLDQFCMFYLGQTAPMYGDDESVKDSFYEKLTTVADKKSWF